MDTHGVDWLFKSFWTSPAVTASIGFFLSCAFSNVEIPQKKGNQEKDVFRPFEGRVLALGQTPVTRSFVVSRPGRPSGCSQQRPEVDCEPLSLPRQCEE